MRRTKILLMLLGLSWVVVSCTGEAKSDAYGQFEATETTISAKASGELLSFTIDEGDEVQAHRQVGVVDTTQMALKKKELESQLAATRSKIANINAQVQVQQEQLQTALTDLKRIQSLAKDSAATQKQLDDTQGRVRTLRKQIDASQTQKQSVRAEIKATQARADQLEQQIKDAHIINPIHGTVLTKYVEPHEVVGQGQPLYQIANLDTLNLRVYVSGAQLPSIKLGQNVQVLVDKNANENQQLSGHISWIASEAEFTPKMIQTKQERVTQVYAVKVKVPNPRGILKIGMPGEVNFEAGN